MSAKQLQAARSSLPKRGGTTASTTASPSGYRIQQVPVTSIRPEPGLARKRDRGGHQDLCRSIKQFGVLTPITVRLAPDSSGDYLLIKGQGRTLACRILGLRHIPAIVVDQRFAETEKVQQFLVENVARLRMRPVDRALLIAHARAAGEETSSVASRFGITATTVRKLEAQLDGASSGEMAALRAGTLTLSAHAVIARHVRSSERAIVSELVGGYGINAKDLDALFDALGWSTLMDLDPTHLTNRMALLHWCCETLEGLPRGTSRDRIRQMSSRLPLNLGRDTQEAAL